MVGRSLLLSLFLLLRCMVDAAAAEPVPIALHHTSWTAREGAPQMMLTMTQTRDGWLWLGGSNGLFRFDGVRFERYADPAHALPAVAIGILNAFDDGSLWIGYRYGGVSVLSHGQLRSYNQRDGLPDSAGVWGLEHDSSGRMWAATARGMFHLDGQRWLPAGEDFALPVALFKTLMLDRQGNLWAQGDEGVYKLAPGARRFIKATPENGTGVLVQFPDDSVWSWNAPRNAVRQLTPSSRATASYYGHLAGDMSSLLVDRQGGVWAGRVASLEYHTAQGIQRSGREQGLSGQWVTAIFQDREGSIWASTSTGIDRFRHQRISAVHFPNEGVGNPLMADGQGGVWAGTMHLSPQANGLFAQHALRLASATSRDDAVSASYRDPAGVEWFGGEARLWRKNDQRVKWLSSPPATDLGWVINMASDDTGALWSLWERGLMRVDAAGRWQEMAMATGLPHELPRVLGSAPQLGLWLGYARSRVLQLQGGRWRLYGALEGLDVGMVEAVHVKNGHVWVGGESGTALLQGGRFMPLVGAGGRKFGGVASIVELGNGDLWLDSGSGLIRIPAAQLQRWIANPAYQFRYEVLDSLDGLSGNEPVRYPTPSMIPTSDEKLWLSTASGIFYLDPAERPAPQPAPAVLIQALGPPGKPGQTHDGMQLAQNTTALQVDYTALALAMPERVAFRYRLNGVDTQWQEVGARRTAYYNNLGPGNYSFEVEATDYAGDWTGQPTRLAFRILPTIPQSWWFKTLCGLLLLTACWLLYRRRMRNFADQAVARLQERTRERERIARELHDTLLQSVQALVLHVHAATLKLPPPDPVRRMIEQALQQADDVMLEGRERVSDLRASEAGRQDLLAALNAAGNRLGTPDMALLQVQVAGDVRALHVVIYPEVLSIVTEAIANAYHHANASRIDVRLDYRSAEFRVSISDDGDGLPAEVVAAGGRSNHWGICGMRERAARIGARLVLRSEAGAGTEWRLTLPAGLAYQVVPRGWWQRWRQALVSASN